MPSIDFSLSGLDPRTGAPLDAAPSLAEIVDRAAADRLSPDRRELLTQVLDREAAHLGEPDRKGDLTAMGWAAVFPETSDAKVEAALAPLLDRRRQQAGPGCQVFAGADGYRPGETVDGFLARHKVGTGAPSPATVPYYLMLVGSPAEIPFDFQSGFDVRGYAVGRLGLGAPEEYGAYAAGLAAAEEGGTGRGRQAALFGAANDDDPDDSATVQMCEFLVRPVERYLRRERPDRPVEAVIAEGSTKEGLKGLLARRPALLFTACHGLAMRPETPPESRQALQGGLVCRRQGEAYTLEDDIWTGGEVTQEGGGEAAGLLAFFFACFSAGAPEVPEGTVAPFLADLPRRLLAHPQGGALAVLGHIDRAWGYSFLGLDWTAEPEGFQKTLTQILDGQPVGAALEPINRRYARFMLEKEKEMKRLKRDEKRLASLWVAAQDAKNYAILGDPAARLAGG